MNNKLIFSLCLLTSILFATSFITGASEIHAKHFLHGIPLGTPETNDLIVRDIYALSSNDTTKFADWVSYRLDAGMVTGTLPLYRNWRTDPWLEEHETLELKDYKGAYKALKMDLGHQAPLAAFRGTKYWRETNYLSNITPQRSYLNRGLWAQLERKVRNLALSGVMVYVITGPFYEAEMPSLPNADEPHEIPSGYWKIILIQPKGVHTLNGTAFAFEQDILRHSEMMDHVVSIDEIEERTGLDFLWDLPNTIENTFERHENKEWAMAFLKKRSFR